MTVEFQTDLLQWLAQNKNGKRYVSMIEPDIFDLDTQYTVYSLIRAFTVKYNSQPTKASLLEYFDREAKSAKSGITPEVYDAIVDSIKEAYEEFTGNGEFIREVVIEKYQIKLSKKLLQDNIHSLKEEEEGVVENMYKKLSSIKRLSEDDDEENNKGRFALQEFVKGQRSVVEGAPTYLKALNRMTATGGFYSPQLVVIMGGPKGFKTGTLLNIAMNYVRDGKKVYYVDCENGQDRLLDRFYQCMLQANWHEYSSGDLDDTLEEMVKRFQVMGGDFKADFFPAHTKSIADVEDALDELKEEHNWVPDIICYDYLDLMKPMDHRISEKRLMIQAVYFDAIRLQKKKNVFGLGLSQVNKEAVNKPVIDMKGFAEDFGKAANCHAAFAICRTEDEKQAGVMRIVPVVQRDGVAQHSGHACFAYVDEGHMAINEIDKTVWEAEVEKNRGTPSKGNKTKRTTEKTKRPLTKARLKDE